MNRLKALRKSRGLTQTDLANRLGVTAITISRYEQGSRDMSTDMVNAVCKIFNCTADYLLGLSDQQKTDPRPESRESDDPLLFTQLQELNDLFLRYTPAQKAQALSFLRFLAKPQDNTTDPQD